MTNFTKLNQVKVFKSLMIFVLLVPVKGIDLMSGFPFTDFNNLFFSLIFSFLVINIQKITKLNYLLLIVIFFYQRFFSLEHSNLVECVCARHLYSKTSKF